MKGDGEVKVGGVGAEQDDQCGGREGEHEQERPQGEQQQVEDDAHYAGEGAGVAGPGVVGEDGHQRRANGAADQQVVRHGGQARGGAVGAGGARVAEQRGDDDLARQAEQPTGDVAQEDDGRGAGDAPHARARAAPRPALSGPWRGDRRSGRRGPARRGAA